MSPLPHCEVCGKRVEMCECPEADEDDKDYCDESIKAR